MLLPLRDAMTPSRLPVVTILLITLNVGVWLFGLLPTQTQAEGSVRQITRHDMWVAEYGAVPCELLGRCENQPGAVVIDRGLLDPSPQTVIADVDPHEPVLTLITSMFLHGGFFHLAFNMCFLWAFGRNVEGSMNPAGFLVFYLVAGMASGLAQSLAAASATVPTIGASGAIAAVVAGYLVLYPRARVLTWVLFPLPIFLWLYAWLVAGGWGILQVAATWLSLFAPTTLDGGVATIAHLAGFAFGLLLISVFADRPHPEYAMIIAAEQADRE